MFRAVLFDLDDTLYDSSGSSQRLRDAALDAMIAAGLGASSKEHAKRVLRTIIKKHGSNSEHHFDYLCKHFKVHDPAKVIAAGIVAYHEMKVSLHTFPDTVPTLLSLIKRGYHLGLVTNGIPVKQWDKILRLRIEEYFDVILVSDSSKTSTRKDVLIKKALSQLQVRPREAVFVGDKLDADIESANRCGLYSVRILHGSHKERQPARENQRSKAQIHTLKELLKLLA
jgi:putative hydrolase of the HAD superfamily